MKGIIINIIPRDDVMIHEHNPGCMCGPYPQRPPDCTCGHCPQDVPTTWVHHALDGRKGIRESLQENVPNEQLYGLWVATIDKECPDDG